MNVEYKYIYDIVIDRINNLFLIVYMTSNDNLRATLYQSTSDYRYRIL